MIQKHFWLFGRAFTFTFPYRTYCKGDFTFDVLPSINIVKFLMAYGIYFSWLFWGVSIKVYKSKFIHKSND